MDETTEIGEEIPPLSKTHHYGEIAILLFAMIFPTLLTYVYFVYLADSPDTTQKLAYSVGKTFQFALPVFWVGIVCRQRWLVRGTTLSKTIEGVAFGMVVATIIVTLYNSWLRLPGGALVLGSSAREAVLQKIEGLGLDINGLILVGIFYSVIHSGLEEYYWRWFVFGRMQKFMSWFWAAVISSLGFMAHHVILLGTYFGYNSVYCWLGSTGVALGGFFWAWLYRRTDSIWGPWIGHGFIDVAIFCVGIFIMTGH